MDGWMDGWMDGLMDGHIIEYIHHTDLNTIACIYYIYTHL